MTKKTSQKILVIEDDKILADLVIDFLLVEGFDATLASSGSQAERLCKQQKFNLIICDLLLPDCHGFDLIEKLEFTHTCPLIYLTALGDDKTHIKGLEKGAADFIPKPVEPELLLARIKANLRQFSATRDQITVGEFNFNARKKQLTKSDHLIPLTNQEFDILWLFIRYSDGPISRDLMFEHIVGRPYDGTDRAADLKVSRLRKKLQSQCPEMNIETIRGEGYILTINNSNIHNA